MLADKSVRCDGCGVEAWVSVQKFEKADGRAYEDGTLTLCAHHYNKNSILLHAEGWVVVIDERERINNKPSVSADVA